MFKGINPNCNLDATCCETSNYDANNTIDLVKVVKGKHRERKSKILESDWIINYKKQLKH